MCSEKCYANVLLLLLKKIKDYKKVKTWEDCAALCQKNNKCTAWTYRPKMKKQKKALLCSIYSKFQKFSSDKFTVSGTNSCPPPLTTTKLPETTTISDEEEYEEASTEILIQRNGSTYSCSLSMMVALNKEIKCKDLSSSCVGNNVFQNSR